MIQPREKNKFLLRSYLYSQDDFPFELISGLNDLSDFEREVVVKHILLHFFPLLDEMNIGGSQQSSRCTCLELEKISDSHFTVLLLGSRRVDVYFTDGGITEKKYLNFLKLIGDAKFHSLKFKRQRFIDSQDRSSSFKEVDMLQPEPLRKRELIANAVHSVLSGNGIRTTFHEFQEQFLRQGPVKMFTPAINEDGDFLAFPQLSWKGSKDALLVGPGADIEIMMPTGHIRNQFDEMDVSPRSIADNITSIRLARDSKLRIIRPGHRGIEIRSSGMKVQIPTISVIAVATIRSVDGRIVTWQNINYFS